MQFTGLKDKNEVEIYEGDVVKRYENIYYLECDGSMYGYYKNLEDGPVHFGWLQWGSEFEVIGNIHENQELL